MSGTPSQVNVERIGGVAVIRIAAPPQGFVSVRGAVQLNEALAALEDDPAIGAVVLTGGLPGVFIRHADVRSIAKSARALAEGRISPEDMVANPFIALCARLDGMDKPVIAAINGTCMGGGLEIALACTMRIAGADVNAIGLPEIRLDIIPGCGGVPRLARVIGPHRARLHALRGDVLDAPAAMALGIVDEVAPDALARAISLCQRFATRNPTAVAAIMRAVDPEFGPEDTARQFGAIIAQPQFRQRLDRFVAEGERLDALA